MAKKLLHEFDVKSRELCVLRASASQQIKQTSGLLKEKVPRFGGELFFASRFLKSIDIVRERVILIEIPINL